MKNNLTRRDFIRTATVGTGVFAVTITSGFSLFAESSGKVDFDTKKARGGCAVCEKAVDAMLRDKKMLEKLKALFPEDTKVCFYVRKQRKMKLPEGIHIAVGNCTKALRNSADLFIPGCGRRINKDSVFQAVVGRYAKTSG